MNALDESPPHPVANGVGYAQQPLDDRPAPLQFNAQRPFIFPPPNQSVQLGSWRPATSPVSQTSSYDEPNSSKKRKAEIQWPSPESSESNFRPVDHFGKAEPARDPTVDHDPLNLDFEVLVGNLLGALGIRSDDGFIGSPGSLRRRSRTNSIPTSPRLPSKATKRITQKPPEEVKRPRTSEANEPAKTAEYSSVSKRAFICPLAIYGCSSSFGSKNEWKRHINIQHIRTGFWRCDQCNQTERKPNDFNRKDLFVQHVRRMHPPPEPAPIAPADGQELPPDHKPYNKEAELASIANRCFKRIRSLPEEACCIFCDGQFRGPGSWDERLEHVGKHMEATKKETGEPIDPNNWRHDKMLEEYLARESIIVSTGSHWVLDEERKKAVQYLKVLPPHKVNDAIPNVGRPGFYQTIAQPADAI